MGLTEGQEDAVAQLRAIERADPRALQVVSVREDGTRAIAEISIDCEEFERAPGGFALMPRERFLVSIPSGFPFRKPDLWASHKRFAGHHHVQWMRHLCLYQAPAVEWLPGDGMFGFVQRVSEFLRQGARAELDPVGGPLHPPVAYATLGRLVVPRADTPVVRDAPWVGAAALDAVSDVRADIVGWHEVGEAPDGPVAAAILLAKEMLFEYPASVRELLRALEERGVTSRLQILTLMLAALQNPEGAPLLVVVGAPMRGTSGGGDFRQHLAAWQVDATAAANLRLAALQFGKTELLREVGSLAEKAFWQWAAGVDAAWCYVREDRPEIVTRRDERAPISWFRGKTVALWGCGALGSHIAEYLARAGVRELVLRDNGTVTPGLLVRQQFTDADLGRWKAHALAARLTAIRPRNLPVVCDTNDLLQAVLDGLGALTSGVDVVIDTTGSNPIATALERGWMAQNDRTPFFASMAVDATAAHGFVAVAPASHTGGIADVVRQGKLEACSRAGLQAYAEAFWPDAKSRPLFQPEPGCSEPTFAASAADVAQLAGALANRLALSLSVVDARASAHFLTRADVQAPRANASFEFEADQVLALPGGDLVRLSRAAWREMQGWIRKSRRERGAGVETGGLLFGEYDRAAKVIWVSEVCGPPPDSRASTRAFVCGTSGVAALNDEKKRRTRGGVTFLGMWHTHPGGPPTPSTTDIVGMGEILAAEDPPARDALLLIVGGGLSAPLLGATLFSRASISAHDA